MSSGSSVSLARRRGLDYTYGAMPALEPFPGLPPAAGQAPDVELRPAKISDRFIAYFLDIAPFAAGYCLTVIYMAQKARITQDTPEFMMRVAGLWFGLYLVYQFLGNAAGATIGKRLMGLRVVRRDGQALGIARGFLRAAGYVLSTPLCNLGFLLAFFHPESRALHDLLAGSVVIEPRPKNPAEASLLFLSAFVVLSALIGGVIYLHRTNPTPADRLAIEKAREGLQVMAAVEEAHKSVHGTYTASLGDLAQASGDAEQFKSAMGEIFEPNLFQLRAGNKGYRIQAAAKDRRKTRVAIQGPPATLQD